MHEHLERARRHFGEDVAVLTVLIAQGRNPIPMKRRGQDQELGTLTKTGTELVVTTDGAPTAYQGPVQVVLDGWVAD